MTRIPFLAFLPPVIFGALAILFYTGMQRSDPDGLPSAFEGRAAPQLDLVALADLPPVEAAMLTAPGVKLVNFWASWCAPCRVEHPTLQALADEGVPIYGVNYKDDPGNAQDFLAELGNPYVGTSADPQGRTARDWGVYGVPETFVIDGDGKVVLRFAGPVTQRALAEKIRPAIREAAE